MRAFSVAFALVSILLVGCKHGGDVVGKWQGTVVPERGFENDPGVSMMKGLAGAISFDLKADKTFSGTMFFPIEGTYSVSGSTVTLTASKMMGIEGKSGPDSKPLVFQMSADGKTLTAPDTGTGKGKMHGNLVLTKQP